MKFKILTVLMFLTLSMFGQFDSDLIGLERKGDNYVIRDTTVTGADTVIQVRIVSAETFLADYFFEVERNLQKVAIAMAKALEGQEQVAKQRAELQKLGLLSQYIQYVDGLRTIQGDFQVRYNNTATTLTAGEDEHLYTQGGTKVVNVLEISVKWIRCTLITQGNEVIDVYEIRPGLWAGQGANGLLVITQ